MLLRTWNHSLSSQTKVIKCFWRFCDKSSQWRTLFWRKTHFEEMEHLKKINLRNFTLGGGVTHNISVRMFACFYKTFEDSKIFSSHRNLQNLFSSKGLVKISASWSSIFTWSMRIFPLRKWSRRKWWRIWMCMVFECCTGLYAILIALSLSQ